MTAFPWQKLLKIYRWVGIAIGIWLLVMECFDALLTPKPDWLWFGAGALLIWLCRPRKETAPAEKRHLEVSSSQP